MIHYSIPSSLDDDILRFENNFAEFKGGRLQETSFIAKRVKMGIYLERNDTTYMCRIRCGANIITPQQLGMIGVLSRQYGNSKVHVTTRAEVQLHSIKENDVITVLRRLRDIGLSCKGGGGNAIRNIVTNHDSGTCWNEVFDVQPCVIALTNRLIAEPDSWELPRKVKIAFSSLADETAFCCIQDIGFVARFNAEGQRGFKVYVGGGLGARPKAGVALHEFIPEDEVYHVVKALKNMFHLYGDRKNKQKNRVRFLLHEDLGAAAFRTYYRQELNKVFAGGYPELQIEHIDNTENAHKDIDLTPGKEDSNDFRTWKKRHVAAQKQEGLFRVKLPLFTGDLGAQDCCELEKMLRPFGENSLRFGTDQNLYLINIPERYLPNIYRGSMGCTTLIDRPLLYSNLIACAGAQGC
ncbi:MAG: nitrite/sulfite reductase, partial [Candidatus Electrothrix sp. ATG2]|nr:nitrite/sulfite reductase [Candidatus Electrothrix sp. ATG2]